MTHSFPTRRSADLIEDRQVGRIVHQRFQRRLAVRIDARDEPLGLQRDRQRLQDVAVVVDQCDGCRHRSEEHTSELQSLMRISYAVFCLKKKKTRKKLLYTLLDKTQIIARIS